MAFRKVSDGRPVTIFVDPTLRDPFFKQGQPVEVLGPLLELSIASKHTLPAMHRDFDPERLPYLLHLRDEESAERLVAMSFRIACDELAGEPGVASSRTVCAWLVGESRPLVTAQRLARIGRVVRPDGHPWYLRYWDPRVMALLPFVLTDAAWEGVQAALGNWCFLNTGFDLQTAQLPLHDKVRSGAASPAPWRIDPLNWQALTRIEPLHRVGSLADFNLQAQADVRRVLRLFDRCVSSGYAAPDDMVVWACTALSTHDDFHLHPPVAEALSQSPTLLDALGQFDDSFWLGLPAKLAPVQTTP